MATREYSPAQVERAIRIVAQEKHLDFMEVAVHRWKYEADIRAVLEREDPDDPSAADQLPMWIAVIGILVIFVLFFWIMAR